MRRRPLITLRSFIAHTITTHARAQAGVACDAGLGTSGDVGRRQLAASPGPTCATLRPSLVVTFITVKTLQRVEAPVVPFTRCEIECAEPEPLAEALAR
jgi:hypothetical protein